MDPCNLGYIIRDDGKLGGFYLKRMPFGPIPILGAVTIINLLRLYSCAAKNPFYYYGYATNVPRNQFQL